MVRFSRAAESRAYPGVVIAELKQARRVRSPFLDALRAVIVNSGNANAATGRPGLDPSLLWTAQNTDPRGLTGTLPQALAGADRMRWIQARPARNPMTPASSDASRTPCFAAASSQYLNPGLVAYKASQRHPRLYETPLPTSEIRSPKSEILRAAVQRVSRRSERWTGLAR